MLHTLDLDVEHREWSELTGLVESLSEREVLEPGYFPEGWSIKDMLAHIGTWLAEAGVVLEQIRFGTYRRDELDIEAMNQQFLDAMRDVPWPIVRAQASASRARMLQEWRELPELTESASEWVRKAGPDHYLEHLPRLREWVAELRRAHPGWSG